MSLDQRVSLSVAIAHPHMPLADVVIPRFSRVAQTRYLLLLLPTKHPYRAYPTHLQFTHTHVPI
jgi:hypothetical protein